MSRLSRRGLLTLAAAAALPAACSRPEPAAGPVPATSPAGPSVPPATSAAPRATVGPAATAVAPKPSATKTGQAPPVSRGGGPVPARAGRVKLGAYLSLSGRSLTQSLALRRGQLGREESIVHMFWGWNEHFERPPIGKSTLMISWNGVRLSEVTGGGSDKLIAAAAKRLAGWSKPTLLRWGWEMNGNWFDWDGSHNGKNPAAYVKAWQRMHRIFADQGADNVAWVWSPNWNSGPSTAWNAMQNYYPGDAYVDWVGVSGYNFDGESPQTMFDPIVSRYGGRKPIMLSETAAIDHGGDSKARWIGGLAAYLKKTPQVNAVVWFDTDTHTDRYDFRIDSSDSALAAYRAMARDQHFTG